MKTVSVALMTAALALAGCGASPRVAPGWVGGLPDFGGATAGKAARSAGSRLRCAALDDASGVATRP